VELSKRVAGTISETEAPGGASVAPNAVWIERRKVAPIVVSVGNTIEAPVAFLFESIRIVSRPGRPERAQVQSISGDGARAITNSINPVALESSAKTRKRREMEELEPEEAGPMWTVPPADTAGIELEVTLASAARVSWIVKELEGEAV
jgi:hypothetical protein